MKGKRRGRTNPISEYRRVQRLIRAIFDPFTARHCPTCTTPCCVKPTRVTPFDVALAVGTGHSFPHLGDRDPYDPALRDSAYRLSASAIPLEVIATDPVESCDFLDKGRCTFPNDLRPFGCTTFLCGPMYEHLPEETIRRLRRLVRELEVAHSDVLSALKNSANLPVDSVQPME